jgi:hypothetical protein
MGLFSKTTEPVTPPAPKGEASKWQERVGREVKYLGKRMYVAGVAGDLLTLKFFDRNDQVQRIVLGRSEWPLVTEVLAR